MRVFIILGIMVVSAAFNAQASTIVLEDGRTIMADIIRQDKTRVIVKDGDSSVTYYTDEIASIDGRDLEAGDSETAQDQDKEKLAAQLLDIIPTSEVISDWVKWRFPPDRWEAILSFLNKDRNIAPVMELRKKGLMKYFSTNDLKAMLGFYSSPEGKQCWEDLRNLSIHTMPGVVILLEKEAKQAPPKRQP